MLERNLLKAGEYVVSVPLGVKVTLQYKPTGTLEKVWIGYDSDNFNDEKDSKILCSQIFKNSKVPNRVGTNNGSVFVEGILYTDKYPNLAGSLDSEIQKAIIDIIINNEADYNFFAGSAYATSINLGGALQIRNWLKLQGFNILPGCLMLTGDPDDIIKKSLQLTSFKYELLMGYFVFDKTQNEYLSLNKSQKIIDDIQVYLDKNGYVRSQISFTDDTKLSISYFEMCCKELYPNDLVILDDEGNIITKYPLLDVQIMQHSYTCPFCGKIYLVNDEYAKCPDTHCFSRSYSDINHFLNTLNLPNLEYSRYLELIDCGKLNTFSDILLIDELSSCIIETSFYQILDAIIPIWAVRNREVIWNLCSTCNNSWDSLEYYISNPNLISSDLGITDQSLVSWLSDTKNVSTIKEFLNYTNIVISSDIKKFNGAPIFRGKNIWITGRFLHGSTSEIESILRSYSANITPAEKADCGIVGDVLEGIDGSKVNMLKNKNIPVFTESEFFNKYQIDEDLN